VTGVCVARLLRFAYSRISPLRIDFLVSQLVQTESSTVRPPSRGLGTIPAWQLAILAGLLFWLYWSTLLHLVGQWLKPDFGHGFFVPLFSAYVLWQERGLLAQIPLRPSWSGVPVLVFALCVMVVGQLGAELFSAPLSLLLVLAGLIILFLGWKFFRATLFPWAFLLMMIPIPTLLLSQVTFPLQLLVSRISAETLRTIGIPVALQGNVLRLASMPLNVAEACSGIRSLTSLLTLAIIYGYLMEKRLWVRWLLALASLPIAVAANSVRIIGTGMIVQYWDPDMAEGTFHTGWGVLVFVMCLLMLYALHALINVIWPDKRGREAGVPSAVGKDRSTVSNSAPRFALAAALIALTAVFLQSHANGEVFPPRLRLQSFPEQLGPWAGTDRVIPQDELPILGPGEFLLRDYQDPDSAEPGMNLFIAYFPSQRTNDTPHSPQHCLPGAGWTPIENSRISLSMPGHAPFPANRYLIAMGDSRQLVLYWFWAHDRGIASEYWFKYYLVKDSLKMHRSDGAMVRIMTSMLPGETADAAQQRVLPFLDGVMPLLNNYIPR
jgi:exosortase D (VPLPA-CTERM-specific)